MKSNMNLELANGYYLRYKTKGTHINNNGFTLEVQIK